MSIRVALLLCLVCAASACPSEDPPEKPTFEVTLDAPEIIEIAGDQTLPITARVTNAGDGSPATGYTFSVQVECACTVIQQPSDGTGTETFLIHPRDFGIGLLQAVVKRKDTDDGAVHSNAHFFVFIPDGGEELFSTMSETTLTVGERRPVAGVARTRGSAVGAWQSTQLPTFTIDDPAIATVDANGMITGLSGGQTTLRMSIGDLETAMTITVDDTLAIGRPPDGITDLHMAPTTNNVLTVTSASSRSSHSVVVDARGYPHAIMRFGWRALLVSWTGTGFGTELLPDRFDITTTANIAIDGRDRLYVITAGDYGLTRVYDRAASDLGGTWNRRILDYHVPELDALGAEWTSYLRGSPDTAISLLSNAGDGIELAYRVIVDLRPAEREHDCAGIYRYASISPSSITTNDIAIDQFDLPNGGPCDSDAMPVWQPFVLFRASDGTTQFQLPNGNRAPYTPESFWVGVATYARDSSGLWHTPEGVPNDSGGHFPRPSPRMSIDVLDLPFGPGGTPTPSIVLEALSGVTIDAPFLFYDRGQRFGGINTLGPIAAQGPGNELSTGNSLSLPFAPVPATELDRVDWSVSGVAVSDHRVHILARDEARTQRFHILVAPIPAPASATAPEEEGRIATSASTFAPDIVLADGTRLAIGVSGGTRHLFRSAGVDAPWTQLAGTTTIATGTRFVESAGAVYLFDTSAVLQRSTDQATSFSAVTAATVEDFRSAEHLAVSDAGFVFDLGNKLVYARRNATAAGSPWATITLPGATPAGWTIDTGPRRRLIADATGFTLLAQSIGGTIPPAVHVRRYDWTGALVSTTDFAPADGISFEDLRLADGALSSDGRLVFVGVLNTLGTYTARAHSVNLTTGEWHTAMLGAGFTTMPSNVLALPDGRFAVGASRLDTTSRLTYQYQQILVTSTDSRTWSAPTAPRAMSACEAILRLLPDGNGGVTKLLSAARVFACLAPGTAVNAVQTSTVP